MEIPDPIGELVLRELSIGPRIFYQLLMTARTEFPGHVQEDIRDGITRALGALEKSGLVVWNDPLPGHYRLIRPAQAELRSPRIKLRSCSESVDIDGKVYGVLTFPGYNVVQALMEAGNDGLTKDELVRKSGHDDAVNILKRLAKKPGWNTVIKLAGVPGRRYRIMN